MKAIRCQVSQLLFNIVLKESTKKTLMSMGLACVGILDSGFRTKSQRKMPYASNTINCFENVEN